MVLCSQYRLTDVPESEGNSEQPQGVGLESVGRGLGRASSFGCGVWGVGFNFMPQRDGLRV